MSGYRKNAVVIDFGVVPTRPKIDKVRDFVFQQMCLDISKIKSLQTKMTNGQVIIETDSAELAEQLISEHHLKHKITIDNNDLLPEGSKTNVYYTLEEVAKLNEHIRSAGNIRSDITRSGLSLTVLVRQAEELWKEMRSKYNTLAEEASTEKAARLLLEDRVKALEVHNDSHSSIEVEDQVTHSEFNSLREQNAALQATVEELSKTIAELAAAKPASTPAVLDSEVYAFREQNQALSAEVAALRETTVTPPACESQSGAQSPLSSELAKAQQEILNLREELKGLKEEKAKWESGPKPGKSDKTGKDKGKNKGKNQQSQKPKQAKGGVQNADPKPTAPITPSGSKEVGTSPNGESQGGNPGDESSDGHANDGFTVVNRRKPRSKHKPRTRNEAIAIKADEKSYASLLRNLRSNEEFKELAQPTCWTCSICSTCPTGSTDLFDLLELPDLPIP
ncbi:hypothetical protein pipiens_015421 [Culex pipiens pipiens]|uniref:Uncharacterized protein n=1 Tax=Culex pipiens pipiens TaxID=38569 RepID=A0ABD1CSC4_CULPP